MSVAGVIDSIAQLGWPERQDLRSWLGHLASRGEVAVVRRPVDPRFELAAYLSRFDGECALLFEQVRGSSIPVVGNAICGRAHIAAALGCSEAESGTTFDRAVHEPRACEEVARREAPVFAERLDTEDPLSALPIPVHHERDAGRYLSSGVVVSRDPASGSTNLSINRLQMTGPRELRALILPGRLLSILSAAEERGEPLDVVICVGVDPLLMLASQARPARDVDELEVCSALRTTPLPVTRAPTVDLPVPAAAEIVIEGRVRPGERQLEGPFGEYPRTYGPAGPAPVIDVLEVWHRRAPVFQTILSAGREHLMLGAIPREAELLRRLRETERSVRGVRMTEGGSCRMHLVVALDGPRPGRARNAMLAALAANPVLKRVVAVDDDVDIFSDEDVEWAIATRVQADHDMTVIPGLGGGSLDPSSGRDGVSAKVLIDATVPPERRDAHARMIVPGRDDVDLTAVETLEAPT